MACENCSHVDTCKYADKYKEASNRILDEMKAIRLSTGLPCIDVKVSCDYYDPHTIWRGLK